MSSSVTRLSDDMCDIGYEAKKVTAGDAAPMAYELAASSSAFSDLVAKKPTEKATYLRLLSITSYDHPLAMLTLMSVVAAGLSACIRAHTCLDMLQ